jgi:hypothetical protein
VSSKPTVSICTEDFFPCEVTREIAIIHMILCVLRTASSKSRIARTESRHRFRTSKESTERLTCHGLFCEVIGLRVSFVYSMCAKSALRCACCILFESIDGMLLCFRRAAIMADHKSEHVEYDEEDNHKETMGDIINRELLPNQKHKLQRCWTMWYDGPAPKGQKVNWADSKQLILTFNYVEDFWGLFNNMTPPSTLGDQSNYYMFIEGVQPGWEDAQNEKGQLFIHLNHS